MLDSLVRVSRRDVWAHALFRAGHAQAGQECSPTPRQAAISPHGVRMQRAGNGWLVETLNACCSRPIASLLHAAGNHACTQQSRQATLVPSMTLPAGSDTVTSLYRVLFHLSLMVLVCYGSQTQILRCMNCTTCFTHYSQGA